MSKSMAPVLATCVMFGWLVADGVVLVCSERKLLLAGC
jgi:hypothetical protein